MARFTAILLIAASLMGVMSAPASSSSSKGMAKLNTQYKGYATTFDGKRNACHGIKYSFNEPVAAINTALFGNKKGANVCGKYVKVSLRNKPSKTYTYRVVDICRGCGKNPIGLSKVGMRKFSKKSIAAINWELVNSSDKSSQKPKPKPTKTTAVAKPAKTSSKPSTNHTSKVYSGRGTWFSDTTGSCGVRFSQDDMIVALNQEQMGAYSGSRSRCGDKIRVKAKGSSASVIVRVVDTCPSRYCSHGALDLSRAAFKKFAPMSKGVLELEWSFV
ncbi:hypothetical protein EC957_002787 [Mortierella hygrophila]|uniref:RlpA-like protein double-psi beta-barrel domain-containing protein n=1 Tax=Mortierella hygrophila TaxID=979708 RepID=A0A9P6K7A0_9FUNG|nr:hypothetical protein EC957_002787 [Mortierella hygrophila]